MPPRIGTYLRFVHANEDWSVKYTEPEENELIQAKDVPLIDHELGRCLRLIECTEEEELVLDEVVQDAVYDLWLVVRDNIHDHWMFETDPANIQPNIRPLNHKVAKFIRDNIPSDVEKNHIEMALEILESPWTRRDEGNLRLWFSNDEKTGIAKASDIIDKVRKSGLEPFIVPDILPEIAEEEIELLVWMAINSDGKG